MKAIAKKFQEDEGMATFDQKQQDRYTNSNSVRLNPDFIYYVPKQYVHSEKLARPINGVSSSKKVYALGLDKNTKELMEIISLSINGLTQQFYCEKEGNEAFTVKAVKTRDGNGWTSDVRAERTPFDPTGQRNTGLIMRAEGSNMIVNPIAFQLNKHRACFVNSFKQTNGKWGLDVTDADENGVRFVKLQETSVNDYHIISDVAMTRDEVAKSDTSVAKYLVKE